jgi:hypothetical protein
MEIDENAVTIAEARKPLGYASAQFLLLVPLFAITVASAA